MSKKHLPTVTTTCYDAHAQHSVNCMRTQCSRWIANEPNNNCLLIAVKKGPHTLSEIGKIYGLSRMRICQIEKKIYKELKNILIEEKITHP